VQEYVKSMEREDRFGRAEGMVRDMAAAVASAKEEGGDVDAAVAGLLKDAFSLAKDKKLVREYPNESEDALDFLKGLAARRADGREWLGLDCGFKHLNEVLNGLTEGVFILAGMPSCGKTTLAKQIADHVADVEKVPVMFWSFEQSKEELRIKSLSRLGQVDSRAIWKGRTDPDTWAEVEKADAAYRSGAGRCLTIIEGGRQDTLDRIRSVAVMAKHKAGDKPVLLVLDYLQIIPAGPDAPEDTRARIDYTLSELRRLSRDLKSPVLVISSLSRAGYGEPSKPPSITALKESGGIEYTADAVVCLWRNEAEAERLKRYDRLTVRVEAHVLKNRNGEVGSKVQLDFTPALSDFQPAKE
jgi:replicative DNA helicase